MQRKGKSDSSDTIYTFDIEVVSLFQIDGTWQTFDLSMKDYSNIPMVAVPYIWMFGIDDVVYYGREFMDFTNVLKKISDQNVLKYIWIHNLGYEFQFLLNIVESENWTIEKMCSRDLRKPISFYIPEINIEFRCTYMLTNMKLEVASAIYTDVNKQTGLLNYNQMFSPLTHLSDDELKYCEYDIICLHKLVEHFRNQFGGLHKIPLTQTGIVRREIKKEIDYYYMKKNWSLVPNRQIYLIQMACFSGGYTHANILHSGSICRDVSSYDIASSYPSCFFYEFPMEIFRWCSSDEFQTNDRYYYMVHVRFYNLENKYFNTYVQKSKMFNCNMDDSVFDNGRLMCCSGSFEMYLTDVDYDIITSVYSGECEILECWKSRKGFLDKRILKFILKLYHDKTTLKGLHVDDEKEQELINARYKDSKKINNIYGCCVSNVLKQSSDFKDGIWTRKDFTPEFIDEKLNESKKSWSTLFQYSTGLFITAFARRNVFMTLIQLDKDVLYSDTDSIKYIGQHTDVFDEFNESVLERYRKVCEYYPGDFKMDDFSPIDSKGIKRPLGFFECENDGDIMEFKTLGAKKYVYRLNDGLHLTLSGVSKSAVKYLNDDINNFKDGFVFGYEQSGKLTHYYMDDMVDVVYTDKDGNVYSSSLNHGIVLAPTSYTIGVTDEYELLIKDIEQRGGLDK